LAIIAFQIFFSTVLRLSQSDYQKVEEVKKEIQLRTAKILFAIFIIISSQNVFAAEVEVYAEGAYTATDLVVKIYTNIDTDYPLTSAGVELTYDNSKLTFISAEQNTAEWYFGTTILKHPHQEPQDSGAGVIFLCGKIDSSNPVFGATGTRKLIGKATFLRNETSLPVDSPETYFNMDLGLGIVRTAPDKFTNFVTTSKVVLDNTAHIDMSNVIIRQQFPECPEMQ